MSANSNLPNIVFLDMDGVLCTNRACLAVGNNGMFSYLDPIACLLVRKLCEECNAKIVISSSWRLHYDFYAMKAILNAACAKLGDYMCMFVGDNESWRTATYVQAVSLEEEVATTDRGREILQWVNEHSSQFNNFCVLDDMADMRPIQDSLVRCDLYDGIGFLEYQKAESMLMFGYSINN